MRFAQVNVLGLSIATREAVKDMRVQKSTEGCIVHIGSMSAYRIPNDKGGPGFYAATKMAGAYLNFCGALGNKLSVHKDSIDCWCRAAWNSKTLTCVRVTMRTAPFAFIS